MSDTRHLYQITDDLALLLDAEEIDPAALDQIASEFSDKVAAVGRFVQYLRDSTAPLRARADAFLAEVARREKRAEWLVGYLDRCMAAAGAEEIRGEGVRVRYRKLPDVVEVEDPATVPTEFIRIVHRAEVIRSALTEALKAGREFGPGVRLVTGRRKLEVLG